MSTHTPGPWKALGHTVWEQNPDNTAQIQMIQCICNTNAGYTEEVNRANARLIAAAPDLLEALKGCERVAKAWLEDMKDYPLINAEKTAAVMELERIQTVIAQAEGRS